MQCKLSLSLPLAPFLVLLEILLAFSLYSNRADISSKVRTKPSLILDVTCRNRSVKSLVLLVRKRKLFFFLMSKIVKKAVFSCVHQFLLLWSCLCFKGPQSFWRKDSGVTEGTLSLGSGCCSVSRQKPWTGACLVSSASCLSHSSAHVRCSTPTWQQDWLTYKYPFDHFIPIQLGIVAGRICGGSLFLCKGSWCKFSWRPETVMHCVLGLFPSQLWRFAVRPRQELDGSADTGDRNTQDVERPVAINTKCWEYDPQF